jgi:hypothetical protein
MSAVEKVDLTLASGMAQDCFPVETHLKLRGMIHVAMLSLGEALGDGADIYLKTMSKVTRPKRIAPRCRKSVRG